MQSEGQLIEINAEVSNIFFSYIFISLVSCDSPLVSTFYVLITDCARAFVYSEKKSKKKIK